MRALAPPAVSAAAYVLLQAATSSASSAAPATFAEVYAWVYRTGKEVPLDVPAATCLGLKTPQMIYERTWVSPDAKVHSVEVSEGRNSPFAVLSVRRSLDEDYAGTFWLSGKDGRLSGVCHSPYMYASFVAVKDGSLDGVFQSEKAYDFEKFVQRWRWDRYAPVKRDYP